MARPERPDRDEVDGLPECFLEDTCKGYELEADLGVHVGEDVDVASGRLVATGKRTEKRKVPDAETTREIGLHCPKRSENLVAGLDRDSCSLADAGALRRRPHFTSGRALQPPQTEPSEGFSRGSDFDGTAAKAGRVAGDEEVAARDSAGGRADGLLEVGETDRGGRIQNGGVDAGDAEDRAQAGDNSVGEESTAASRIRE